MKAVIPRPAMPAVAVAGGGVFLARPNHGVGKGFDPSAPKGLIHPMSETDAASRGAVTLQVNRRQRQAGDLRQLIWVAGEFIEHLRAAWALAAGDLMLTGTPAGVAVVVPGKVTHGAIEGLGSLRVVAR